MKRIAFLIGAGASLSAGMPSTSDITKRVLSGEGISRHTSGVYYFGKPSYQHLAPQDEDVPKVRDFLDALKAEIDKYYANEPNRNTNYEDLYYVASQIHDSETREYDNPAIQPLIDKISPKIQLFLTRGELHDPVFEALNYIQDTLCRMLAREPKCIAPIACLRDACQDTEISDVDIFTLNHDTIIENSLCKNNIQFIDGFDKPICEVRYWNPNLFDSRRCDVRCNVRFFKLHGSVNWYQFQPENSDWGQVSIGIPLGTDHLHTRDPSGQMQLTLDDRPILLIGTFNKMSQYLGEPFMKLYYYFYRSLEEKDCLVVSGYSFGDKGINTRIAEWIYSATDKKIIVIHQEPDDLKDAARGAIQSKWDDLVNGERLFLIGKKFEDTHWEEISNSLS